MKSPVPPTRPQRRARRTAGQLPVLPDPGRNDAASLKLSAQLLKLATAVHRQP